MSDGNGALPEGWVKSTIGDVAKIVTGKTPSTKRKEYHGGDIPFVKPGDLDRDVGLSTSETYVTELGATQAPRLPPSTVLVSCIGNLGKVAILERDAICNQQINAILPNDAMESRFTFHWAKTIRSWMQENASATTVTILNKGRFEGAPFPLPPLPEQGRIVSKIESLQAQSSFAREALNDVGQLLKQLRQSVLQAAFSGRLTADWRAAHPDVEPASELLERIRTERRERWEQSELAKYEAKGKKPPKNWKDKYKEPEPVDDSELPDLPEGWCWARLGELIQSVDAGRSPTAQSRPAEDEEHGVLKVSAVTWGEFDPYANKALKPGESIGDTPTPCAGDILVSRANTVELIGAAVLVKTDHPNLMLSDKLLRLNRVSNEIMPETLLFSLRSRSVRNSFEKNATGTSNSMRNLSQAKILGAPIAIAPIEEQKKLTEILIESNEITRNFENEVPKLEASLSQLDQSILAKAFRGELVPQDPNDEPASELLARIRAAREQVKATTRKTSKTKRKTASSK